MRFCRVLKTGDPHREVNRSEVELVEGAYLTGSSLGPEPDSCTAATASLFDHFVGGREQRGRYFEAHLLSCLEVDYQFKFGRQLYWQIGRILPP